MGERRSAAAASEAASDAATSRLADDEKEAQVAQQELSQSTSQLADLEKAADAALLRQQEVERVAVATRARHAAAATKLQALEATLRQREGDLTRKARPACAARVAKRGSHASTLTVSSAASVRSGDGTQK